MIVQKIFRIILIREKIAQIIIILRMSTIEPEALKLIYFGSIEWFGIS